jgi:hypothetical protein
VQDKKIYLPIVWQPSILANSSFEEDTTLVNFPIPEYWPWCQYTGVTDGRGNQHPSGWTYRAYDTGETMPFPAKMQGGNVITATSGGIGENVHRCRWQTPDEERPGEPRAIFLDGDWYYKVFGNSLRFAVKLTQEISGTPGDNVEVSGYILGETRNHTGDPLESDHFIASVQLGGVADTRTYSTMVARRDLPGNERNWNRFSVTTTFPDSGRLTLTVIVQNNWDYTTDFFLDAFSIRQWQ